MRRLAPIPAWYNAVITGDTGINEEAKFTTDSTTTNPIEIIHWEVIVRFC